MSEAEIDVCDGCRKPLAYLGNELAGKHAAAEEVRR